MKTTLISVVAAFVTAVLVYIVMLMFATGMYVETVGNIIVLSSVAVGIVTALTLRLRSRRQ
ncbi:hypothetical protein [Massilia arenae]|uniref:Uncharacterized protein n=1 Tax=Massilia arenae TaxID=2603288 RepID=A0A5C7FY94_9BURK|nr:hypothetical protein [Massilia arenae]TXG00433.1 hypothetical protein FVD38_08705 [Massilia arenae]